MTVAALLLKQPHLPYIKTGNLPRQEQLKFKTKLGVDNEETRSRLLYQAEHKAQATSQKSLLA